MPALPRKVEKLWKNSAKPTYFSLSQTNSTSAFFFSKIHSRNSSSVATIWSNIFLYSASWRINDKTNAQSFSFANRNSISVTFSILSLKSDAGVEEPGYFTHLCFFYQHTEYLRKIQVFTNGLITSVFRTWIDNPRLLPGKRTKKPVQCGYILWVFFCEGVR